jgi:hypothetical protein
VRVELSPLRRFAGVVIAVAVVAGGWYALDSRNKRSGFSDIPSIKTPGFKLPESVARFFPETTGWAPATVLPDERH